MKKKIISVSIILLSIVGTVFLAGLKPEPEQNELLQSTILVDVMNLSREDIYLRVASQGTVEPRTQTSIVTEVSGQVIEVSPAFVVGGYFSAGSVLLRLDDQNYKAALLRSESALASARSQLALERGQTDVALREWNRMSDDQQAKVRAKDLYLREPQLEEAIAKLASAQADLEQAQNDLNKTVILAPYDGLISTKNADFGQFVSSGTAVAEIFAVDYAEVRLPIPESKVSLLELPPLIRNTTNSEPGAANQHAVQPLVELISRTGELEYRWEGRLVRTEAVLDTRTRVLFSVVRIADPYNLSSNAGTEPLRIGTYVNANIRGKLMENVYVLPRHTLQANGMVWVSNQEKLLQARSVEVLSVNDDSVYISSGFEEGDQAIITRMENPLSNSPVQTRLSQPFLEFN